MKLRNSQGKMTVIMRTMTRRNFLGTIAILVKPSQYADNITLHITSKQRALNQLKISTKLRRIKLFPQSNCLPINRGKTKILKTMLKQKRNTIVGVGPEITDITENQELKKSHGEKTCLILGGIIQDNLSWKGHLTGNKESLVPTLRKRLGQLKYLGEKINKRGKLLLPNGYIMSKLIYLMGVWGGAHKTMIEQLQIIQNNTARFVTGRGKREKKWPLLKECKWLDIEELIIFHSMNNMWKIIWKQAPLNIHRSINIRVLQINWATYKFPFDCAKVHAVADAKIMRRF